MFEFVRKHTRALQFVLVLLIFPSFVFFGIQGYTRFTGGEHATVAKVAATTSRRPSWDAAHARAGRASCAGRCRTSTPSCSTRRRCAPRARSAGARARAARRGRQAAPGDDRRAAANARSRAIPQFAPLRNADGSVNRDVLAAPGHDAREFAPAPAPGPRRAPGAAGLSGSAIAPGRRSVGGARRVAAAARGAGAALRRQGLAAKVSPSDAELEAYYKNPAHAAQFQAPEQASIEYVVLDLDAREEDRHRDRRRSAQVLRARTRRATPRPRSAAPATS